MQKSDLHNYQVKAVDFISRQPKCALFMDMGLGKTATCLTAISDFLDDFYVNKVLIIAPLRVANSVWKQEAQKWGHLKNLNISICTGLPEQRKYALSKGNIHVINRENIPWLMSNLRHWDYDMVIIDESSSFKSWKSKRFRTLVPILKHLKSTVLLTGTPSPNGLMDLWSQIYLLDNGKRLGRVISHYIARFFKQSGYMGYRYELTDGSEDRIHELLSDLCLTMKAEDYLALPKRIDANIYVDMPNNIRSQYDELKKEFVLTLNDGIDIEAPTAATLVNKLLQLCNGAVYDAERNINEIHDEKIKALKDVIDDNRSENFLIAYNYKSDLVRLKKAFPNACVLGNEQSTLDKWNRGKIKILLAHPASCGHGLNLQSGGSCIIWFGLNWSLELYQQFNGRLHRQGQTKPVKIFHLAMKDSIDEDILEALKDKALTQNKLLDYLKKNSFY